MRNSFIQIYSFSFKPSPFLKKNPFLTIYFSLKPTKIDTQPLLVSSLVLFSGMLTSTVSSCVELVEKSQWSALPWLVFE